MVVQLSQFLSEHRQAHMFEPANVWQAQVLCAVLSLVFVRTLKTLFLANGLKDTSPWHVPM